MSNFEEGNMASLRRERMVHASINQTVEQLYPSQPYFSRQLRSRVSLSGSNKAALRLCCRVAWLFHYPCDLNKQSSLQYLHFLVCERRWREESHYPFASVLKLRLL